jgi:hypothetical protein
MLNTSSKDCDGAISLWTITFPKQIFESLEHYLFNDESTENGCFLLAHHHKKSNANSVLLIREIINANSYSWKIKGSSSLEPTSAYINQCVIKADASESCLIFVHTHPLSSHPEVFSAIDNETNTALFANLYEILPDRPIASIVLSNHGLYGEVFYENKTQRIMETLIVGKTIKHYNTIGGYSKDSRFNTQFDRQLKAIGAEAQKVLQNLTITIVGLGGVGSPVAVQLARMGVGRLRLIDSDVIDETNLPRVYGSVHRDVGKPKVTVLKNHLKTFSKAKIVSIAADITKKDIIADLADSDVIFGCTDNLASRAVLNDVSVQYYIPLIDSGCRILLMANSFEQAIGKVQVVTPGVACLWCSGILNGNLILQETLPLKERQKLAEEGYGQSVEKQPSIVSLTTLTASIAVNKLLSILGVFGEEFSTRTQIEIINEIMINDNPKIINNCVCQTRSGLGDKRKIISL